MQFHALILATLAAVVSAGPAATIQRRADCPEAANIPACGLPCLQDVATRMHCGTTDYKCLCSDFERVQDIGRMCVLTSCGEDGAAELLKAAKEVCAKCG